MRVGLLIYSSLDIVSGGYLYDRKLVESLKTAGDEVEIISLPWRNYTRHMLDNLSRTLKNRLSNADWDVLLQDELNHPSLFWLNRRLEKRVSYPLVCIVHHLRSSEKHSNWQNSLYRSVERRYLASVDAMIFNSHSTRSAVDRLMVSQEGYPHLVAFPAANHIGRGMQSPQIRQRSLERGPLKLLYVGNVIPRKGLLVLLMALSGIPRDCWNLTVIGSLEADHSYTQKVLRQIDVSGLAGQVQLRGQLQEKELIGAYETSQVLVLPSFYEGYGIAYLEGMAFGLPAIATTRGAACEIISHGKNGFLVTPGRIEDLCEAIQRLISNRGLLLEMSMAARERFLEQPTWEQNGSRIREFLLSILNERR